MKENPPSKQKIASYKNIQKRESKQHKPKDLLPDTNLQSLPIEQLRKTAKQMRRLCSEKQLEIMNIEKLYRMEVFKNTNYKNKVNQSEKYCETVRIKLTERLLQKYQSAKESPLFHNEHGLSPFQLMLLHYSRNEQNLTEHICMICYLDIAQNSHIARLPCSHILHRECAMQHLLYSRNCPGCNENIHFTDTESKINKN